jgi:uncharacterized protein
MVVGVLTVDMRLPGVTSLKHKRHVIRSVKDNVRNKFNVSISETDWQDLWQRAQLGVAGVSGDRLYIHKQMDRVLKFIEGRDEIDVFNYSIDYY